MCRACEALTRSHVCSVCLQSKNSDQFPVSQRKNFEAGRNVALRCEACHCCTGQCGKKKQAKEFAGGGAMCRSCEAGANKLLKCAFCPPSCSLQAASAFAKSQQRHAHSRASRLCCIRCQQREDTIKKKLKRKTAWRCTCHKPIHNDKCQLRPEHAGEKRWRGKNEGVAEDDLVFLEKRQRTA